MKMPRRITEAIAEPIVKTGSIAIAALMIALLALCVAVFKTGATHGA